MSTDDLSRIQYEHGVDPIDWAVQMLTFDLEARDDVAGGLIPAAALTLMDQSDAAYARRMVAMLLNAGWTQPDVTEIRQSHSAESCEFCRLDRKRREQP